MDLQSNRDLAELLRKIGVRDQTKLRLQDTEMPVVLTGDTLQQARPVLPGKGISSAQVPAAGVGIWQGLMLVAHVDCIVEVTASNAVCWVIVDQAATFLVGFVVGGQTNVQSNGDPNTPVVSTAFLVTKSTDPGGLVGIPQSAVPFSWAFGLFVPSGGRLYLMSQASNVGFNAGFAWREPK